MIKVTVEDKKYKLPERFTIKQWSEMVSWDFEQPQNWRRIIEAGCGIPQSDLLNARADSLQLFIGFIIAHMNGRRETELPDFNELSFGQFVDLDCYIALGIEKNLTEMLAVLDMKPKYSDEALWIIDQYVMWRTAIYRQYKSLFGLNDKDFEAFKQQHDDEWDPMSIPRGWYRIIVELANDNLLNIDAVTNEPLKKVLNFMALNKEKQLAEAEAIRKQRQTIK